MARGEHIKVRRANGLYTHHGIDLGDGTVVHFSGEPLRMRDARIERVSLEEFLQGGLLRVVRHRGKIRPAEEVIATALSFLGKTGYDMFLNNCEHFATFCKTGNARSGQVRRAAKAVATAAVAGAGIVVYVAARRLKRNATG